MHTLLCLMTTIHCRNAVRHAPLRGGLVFVGLDCHITQQLCTVQDGKQKLLGDWHQV